MGERMKRLELDKLASEERVALLDALEAGFAPFSCVLRQR